MTSQDVYDYYFVLFYQGIFRKVLYSVEKRREANFFNTKWDFQMSIKLQKKKNEDEIMYHLNVSSTYYNNDFDFF